MIKKISTNELINYVLSRLEPGSGKIIYPPGCYILYNTNNDFSYFVNGEEVDESIFKNYIVKQRYSDGQ
jgi:hypothetical protein